MVWWSFLLEGQIGIYDKHAPVLQRNYFIRLQNSRQCILLQHTKDTISFLTPNKWRNIGETNFSHKWLKVLHYPCQEPFMSCSAHQALAFPVPLQNFHIPNLCFVIANTYIGSRVVWPWYCKVAATLKSEITPHANQITQQQFLLHLFIHICNISFFIFSRYNPFEKFSLKKFTSAVGPSCFPANFD